MSDAIGCPLEFIVFPLLTISAACIGLSAHVAINVMWKEPAILWFIIASNKGQKKAAALRLLKKPLEEIGCVEAENWWHQQNISCNNINWQPTSVVDWQLQLWGITSGDEEKWVADTQIVWWNEYNVLQAVRFCNGSQDTHYTEWWKLLVKIIKFQMPNAFVDYCYYHLKAMMARSPHLRWHKNISVHQLTESTRSWKHLNCSAQPLPWGSASKLITCQVQTERLANSGRHLTLSSRQTHVSPWDSFVSQRRNTIKLFPHVQSHLQVGFNAVSWSRSWVLECDVALSINTQFNITHLACPHSWSNFLLSSSYTTLTSRFNVLSIVKL